MQEKVENVCSIEKKVVLLQRQKFEYQIIMLKTILSISGKPGLYKLINRGHNMLIVESLLDGKRTPTYARDKIISLADVSMFTTGDDIELWKVLKSVSEKEGGKVAAIDFKKADNKALNAWFTEVLPDWDEDRVYPSDIRKLIQWYNILVNAGITEFEPQEEEKAEEVEG